MSKRPRRNLPVDRKARKIRGVGYILFGGVALWISVALSTSVVGGINANEARDPFTDRPVQEMHDVCDVWTDELLESAENHENPTEWQVRTSAWRFQCGYRAEVSSAAQSLVLLHEAMVEKRRSAKD